MHKLLMAIDGLTNLESRRSGGHMAPCGRHHAGSRPLVDHAACHVVERAAADRFGRRSQTLLSVCNMTHREAYRDIFVVACAIPLVALLAILILANVTGSF